MRRLHVQPGNPGVDSPTRRILVIGGAGYIGSVLVRHLLGANYEVRVLDQLLFGVESLRELHDHPGFELIHGDLRNVSALIHSVRGRDAVIHLGGIVGDGACAVNPRMTREINHAATGLIAEVCRRSGVSRLLYASTCSVYGSRDEVVDETSAVNPVSLYGATKVGAENILLASRTEKFHVTVLRLGTAFGWSPRPRFDLVVNLLTAKAFFEKKVVIYNENQWRPFVHVTDVCRAIRLALEAPLPRVSGGVFNVGSRNLNHRLGQVGEMILRNVAGAQVARESNADIRNYRVSFDKIQSVLGFECEVSLPDGIQEICHYLRAGKITNHTADLYHNHKSVAGNGRIAGTRLALKASADLLAGWEDVMTRDATA